jgi:hypothetical protein
MVPSIAKSTAAIPAESLAVATRVSAPVSPSVAAAGLVRTAVGAVESDEAIGDSQEAANALSERSAESRRNGERWVIIQWGRAMEVSGTLYRSSITHCDSLGRTS